MNVWYQAVTKSKLKCILQMYNSDFWKESQHTVMLSNNNFKLYAPALPALIGQGFKTPQMESVFNFTSLFNEFLFCIMW